MTVDRFADIRALLEDTPIPINYHVSRPNQPGVVDVDRVMEALHEDPSVRIEDIDRQAPTGWEVEESEDPLIMWAEHRCTGCGEIGLMFRVSIDETGLVYPDACPEQGFFVMCPDCESPVVCTGDLWPESGV